MTDLIARLEAAEAPVKERPILFSGPMVRALLDGRMTQTRRVVRPQPHHGPVGQMVNLGGPDWAMDDGDLSGQWRCPYGVPGDRLWVRETWQVAQESLDWETGSEYDVFSWDDMYGPAQDWLHGDARGGIKSRVFYAADGEDRNPSAFYGVIGLDGKVIEKPAICWHPSVHMPRWASRLTLEITEVRAERLQDISDRGQPNDCIAEGVFADDFAVKTSEWLERGFSSIEKARFHDLWTSINGPDSWDANPWVWAVSFNVLRTKGSDQ